ncbi:hypothetical protein ACFL56_01040 [Candidatus Margulisiibacteriota bacterium]
MTFTNNIPPVNFNTTLNHNIRDIIRNHSQQSIDDIQEFNNADRNNDGRVDYDEYVEAAIINDYEGATERLNYLEFISNVYDVIDRHFAGGAPSSENNELVERFADLIPGNIDISNVGTTPSRDEVTAEIEELRNKIDMLSEFIEETDEGIQVKDNVIETVNNMFGAEPVAISEELLEFDPTSEGQEVPNIGDIIYLMTIGLRRHFFFNKLDENNNNVVSTREFFLSRGIDINNLLQNPISIIPNVLETYNVNPDVIIQYIEEHGIEYILENSVEESIEDETEIPEAVEE